MCECVNCECKTCGSQNPKRLVGKPAKRAGVTDWMATWWCDTTCKCCDA